MNPINGPRNPQVHGPTEAHHPQAVPASAPQAAPSAREASTTRLSEKALELARAGQGTESAKVVDLRRRIAEGSLVLDARRIAEAMLVRL